MLLLSSTPHIPSLLPLLQAEAFSSSVLLKGLRDVIPGHVAAPAAASAAGGGRSKADDEEEEELDEFEFGEEEADGEEEEEGEEGEEEVKLAASKKKARH